LRDGKGESPLRTTALAARLVAAAFVCGACSRAPAPQAARPQEPGPDAGTVFVQVQPYGVEVAADGISRCRTPCSFRIAPGLHRISVRKSGFLPWQEDVRVDPGGEVQVSASLVGSH
jgi:PEGA domain